MVELYKMNTPTISELVKGEGKKDKGVAVFAAMVLRLVQFFGGTWTKEQIMECAQVCYDEWYYFTFAELGHFAQRAKAGKFKIGDRALIYGPFSPSTLIDWLTTYAAETDEKRGAYYGAMKSTTWAEPENPVSDERVKALFDEFTREIQERQRIEAELAMTEQDKENMRQQRILQKRIDAIANDPLVKVEKGKTTEQVPDKDFIEGL